ncbi:RWD domain-containing protein 2B, partial [Toxocara canis]
LDREQKGITKSGNGVDEFAGEEEIFARYWIYSHHLRSNVKRKNIEAIAKMLCLNGFSSPGKPGIIIVEGTRKDCQKFWEQIRVWNWKHIAIRHKEESPKSEGFLCLDKFKEIVFSSNDGRRIELAELKKYLSDYSLDYGFAILLNM